MTGAPRKSGLATDLIGIGRFRHFGQNTSGGAFFAVDEFDCCSMPSPAYGKSAGASLSHRYYQSCRAVMRVQCAKTHKVASQFDHAGRNDKSLRSVRSQVAVRTTEMRFSDLNDDKMWTQEDLDALRAAVRYGRDAETIAQFLCRKGTVEDVRSRMNELPWSDHMIGRIRVAVRRFRALAT
jgi:hypothetical protein